MLLNLFQIFAAGLQRSWRTVLLVITSLLFSMPSYSQAVSQNEGSESKKKPTLEVRLSTSTPTVCVGSSLKLELEMTNISQEIIKLNKDRFWNSYAYCPINLDDKDIETTCFATGSYIYSRGKNDFILFPGVAQFETTDWPLKEEYLKAGKYTFKVWTYGIQSKVQFELFDCEPEDIKEQ